MQRAPHPALWSACRAGSSSSPTDSPTASASSPAIAVGDVTVIAASPKSVVTVRVREQLARVPAPSDAVMTTSAVSGALLVRPDGSFASGSKIDVDLTTLKSDESRRDDFVKRQTLETSRYPTATFVPVQAEGIPAPLTASGEWKATLVGDLTIHAVTKRISWDATVKRSGADVTGTATTHFTFEDFGMQPPSAAVVL